MRLMSPIHLFSGVPAGQEGKELHLRSLLLNKEGEIVVLPICTHLVDYFNFISNELA